MARIAHTNREFKFCDGPPTVEDVDYDRQEVTRWAVWRAPSEYRYAIATNPSRSNFEFNTGFGFVLPIVNAFSGKTTDHVSIAFDKFSRIMMSFNERPGTARVHWLSSGGGTEFSTTWAGDSVLLFNTGRMLPGESNSIVFAFYISTTGDQRIVEVRRSDENFANESTYLTAARELGRLDSVERDGVNIKIKGLDFEGYHVEFVSDDYAAFP